MIELTQQQRELLAAGKAVAVIEPETAEHLVLLRKDVYERTLGLTYNDSEWTPEEIRLMLARCAATSWDGPDMDAYDRYDEERSKRCQ